MKLITMICVIGLLAIGCTPINPEPTEAYSCNNYIHLEPFPDCVNYFSGYAYSNQFYPIVTYYLKPSMNHTKLDLTLQSTKKIDGVVINLGCKNYNGVKYEFQFLINKTNFTMNHRTPVDFTSSQRQKSTVQLC